MASASFYIAHRSGLSLLNFQRNKTQPITQHEQSRSTSTALCFYVRLVESQHGFQCSVPFVHALASLPACLGQKLKIDSRYPWVSVLHLTVVYTTEPLLNHSTSLLETPPPHILWLVQTSSSTNDRAAILQENIVSRHMMLVSKMLLLVYNKSAVRFNTHQLDHNTMP